MIAAAIIAALLLTACSGAPRPAVAVTPPARGPVLQLQRDITTLVSVPAFERSTWGVLVKSLKTDETLYALNARKLLMPASNMKIATLAAAAERLGWDYSYETRVLGVGAINIGFLEGDLIVVGSGDPSIDDWDGAATRLFQGWAERLKAIGVRTVGGRIIGDDNGFEDETLGAGWAWDDLGASFATGVGALQFNENTARLTVTPAEVAGEPPVIAIAAPGAPISVNNQLTTSAAGSPPAIAARRLPGSPILEVRGSVPIGGPAVFRNVSVDNPTQYFVNQLRDALEANGIDVLGVAADIDTLPHPPRRDEGTPFLTHRSPPLSALAATMMKLSQNLYAETLLKTLGGSNGPATADAGRATVRSTLEGWGIDVGEMIVADGSGLSRYNLATPAALVAILTHVARSDRLREPFEAALPLAGREGTLATHMTGTAAEGNARAKTGSFSNARAISGYVRAADGEPLVFSIIANNFGAAGEAVDAAQDAIVVKLAEFSRR